MNQCDGRNCAYYNGTQSFTLGRVMCGYVHKTIDSHVCPRKQSKITEW